MTSFALIFFANYLTAFRVLHVCHRFVYKHFLFLFQKEFPVSKSYVVGDRGMGTHENRGWEVYWRQEGQELAKIFSKIA